jgi:hypothetical protein
MNCRLEAKEVGGEVWGNLLRSGDVVGVGFGIGFDDGVLRPGDRAMCSRGSTRGRDTLQVKS